jgi:enoyl-CoA hydratase
MSAESPASQSPATDATSAGVVRFERNGPIATIRLSRPEARNAIDGRVARGLEAAVDRLESEEGLWVGILAAEGPAFCAGADLKAIAAGAGGELRTDRGGFAGFVERARRRPIVAAVEGPALAGGFELVLACDLVVASRRATFGLPEVSRSLVAAGGGVIRLARALPPVLARELVLTAQPISAERAAQIGLVNYLVEPGEAETRAGELARQIATNAPLAVTESLALLRAAESRDEAELFRASAAALARLAATEDFAEGPRAFLERRAPRWQGR